MSETNSNKMDLCKCSHEAVAFELFKEMRGYHSQENRERLNKLEPKIQMTYFLQIFTACLKATHGNTGELVTKYIPDINEYLNKH